MKAVLICTNGERIACPDDRLGGMRIHRLERLESGRYADVVYAFDGEREGDVWVYREESSKDITAEMRESAELRRRQFFEERGITPPAPMFVDGYLPGETEEEHVRRIAIARGEMP